MDKSLPPCDVPASAFQTRTLTHIHEASGCKQATSLYHPAASGFVLLTASKGSNVSSTENFSTLAFVCKVAWKTLNCITLFFLMICIFMLYLHFLFTQGHLRQLTFLMGDPEAARHHCSHHSPLCGEISTPIEDLHRNPEEGSVPGFERNVSW